MVVSYFFGIEYYVYRQEDYYLLGDQIRPHGLSKSSLMLTEYLYKYTKAPWNHFYSKVLRSLNSYEKSTFLISPYALRQNQHFVSIYFGSHRKVDIIKYIHE